MRSGGGLNGSYTLVADTSVFDDAAVDSLSGGTGTDWFVVNNDAGVKDKVTSTTGETIDDVDVLA